MQKGKSKYDNIVLDGRWKFVEYSNRHTVILENIYNHQRMHINTTQLKECANGTKTISKIVRRRIAGRSDYERAAIRYRYEKSKRTDV